MLKLAKYHIVERSLKEAIDSGKFQVGAQLPTEEELCAQFGFSRTTIGKALDSLRVHGYIERTPGRGTFVKATRVEKQAGSCRSFSEDMASIGLEAGAKLVSYQVVRASEIPGIAGQIGADQDELIHHFVRLRTGNGRPIAIGYTYIRCSVVPAVDIKSLDRSFYAYIRSLGMEVLDAEVQISAVPPTAEQLRLLEADGIALLKSTHVNYIKQDGRIVPFEYTETLYNGDMFSYIARSPQADAL